MPLDALHREDHAFQLSVCDSALLSARLKQSSLAGCQEVFMKRDGA